ncbi:hypothetical protein GIB67_014470 [Kingdonia uniflora]|uniref:Protein PHLOEM PROTEIN 2-LIKE A10 n=1 Tax=Kingdonia uniflora TaxID=39325 RepID=A0A7J7LZB8_9MAGN|nr:hypothetical protein GIB67_014470 [Kingdonia uniflora]
MDLQLIHRGFDFTLRRRKLVLLLAAFGVTGYGAYKVYNLPSVVIKRKKLFKFVETLSKIVEIVSDSAETIGVVSKDLKEFLESDSDEIPNSLKQVAKLSRSREFSESVISVTQGLTIGILRGYKSDSKGRDDGSMGFSDRVVDKLFSTAGSGFASVVVGSFARNLVLAFYSDVKSSGESSGSEAKWVNIVCDEKCRGLIGDCIQMFVSSAVAVYLDKTMDINTYDEIFSGLTNPKHETKVKDFMVSITNGAIETLVKTSHQVMTNSNSYSNSNSKSEGVVEHQPLMRSLFEGGNDSGWVEKVSSTLAVASNRKLVLDVTGRVTFETVRSFLDFLIWKLFDGLKRSVSVFREEVIERGLDVVRYVSAKSTVIVTICLSLCLHVLGGARVLMPA